MKPLVGGSYSGGLITEDGSWGGIEICDSWNGLVCS